MGTIVSIATIIEAIADLVIAILLAGAAYYLFDILRRARNLTEQVRREGEEIIKELEEVREDSQESALAKGAGIAAEAVADLLTRPKKKRKKST